MVLPTVAFIIGAYGMYAFWVVWPRRQGRQGLGRSRGRSRLRLGLVGALAAGLSLLAWFSILTGERESRFQLAGFLGLTWQDGWAAPMAEKQVEPLPVKSQAAGEQPGYALLHPSAPPMAAAPDKKSAPGLKPLPKPKAKPKTAVPKIAAKGAKTTTVAARKDKTTGKAKAKKKKPTAAKASGSRAPAEG
jgi:hypothetical protein